MQKITPFLWFDSQAEEAVAFYQSVFKEAAVGSAVQNVEATPGPTGAAMLVTFELFGQKFIALNGGPIFKFNESVSFVVNCENQDEVDYYWERLSEGGAKSQCGWLKDQFGLSWQIVPTALSELLEQADAERSQRVMAALMQMTKLEIAELQAAFHGNG